MQCKLLKSVYSAVGSGKTKKDNSLFDESMSGVSGTAYLDAVHSILLHHPVALQRQCRGSFIEH
jgi:hypothetical protein